MREGGLGGENLYTNTYTEKPRTPNLSSLVAPKVVITTTYGNTRADKVGVIATVILSDIN